MARVFPRAIKILTLKVRVQLLHQHGIPFQLLLLFQHFICAGTNSTNMTVMLYSHDIHKSHDSDEEDMVIVA